MGKLFLLSTSSFVLRTLMRLGMPGLFLMSALDSSFLVLPFGNDLLLIALVSSNRESLIWIAYVLVSAAGSVLGVFVIDLLMRKAGEKGLERFVKPKKIERLKQKLENKLGITVFVATVAPPPFPFTPVIMTASALQCSRKKLIGAVFVGRIIRYTAEAILALYFGRQVIAYLNSDVVSYVVYALVALAIILSTFSLIRWLKRS
ncbi:MAG TPA: VTT domain-containing protein, partial [Pyrinomonadaceae bacterium]|nr:VTT domain-containing protein [Pyrinomonadaceae bacterium]